MKLANKVKILKDSCDGFYEDLVGKVCVVLEYEPYEDEDEITGVHEYEMFYLVATDRPSKNPYREGEKAELVWAGDVEAVSYIEV